MQLVNWFKSNKVLIMVIIISFISGLLGSRLGKVLVNSDVALQAIVQTESTILGFFGVIVAYILASYDSRLDRLEQQCFDLEATEPIKQEFYKERVTAIHEKINEIEAVKTRLSVVIVGTSILLILSIILSVSVLGIKNFDIQFAESLCPWAVILFFTSINAMVLVFSTISRKIEKGAFVSHS